MKRGEERELEEVFRLVRGEQYTYDFLWGHEYV
jgi:hypothetical protein